jgi:hypothetical protein
MPATSRPQTQNLMRLYSLKFDTAGMIQPACGFRV